jgi:hypothetical protein
MYLCIVQVLQMTFGDWELFKNVVLTLRELDRTFGEGGMENEVRINVTSPEREHCEFSHAHFALLLCICSSSIVPTIISELTSTD